MARKIAMKLVSYYEVMKQSFYQKGRENEYGFEV